MYLINNTSAQVSIPVKSQKRTITLAKGERSEELSDKLYPELSPFIRAFKISMEGFQAQFGSVVRQHSDNVVVSDPKANSGAAKAKAREEKANTDAAAKAQAVKDASEKNKATQAKTAQAKAEATKQEAAPVAEAATEAEQAPAEPKGETKAAKPEKNETTATSKPKSQSVSKRRRSTLSRKAASK